MFVIEYIINSIFQLSVFNYFLFLFILFFWAFVVDFLIKNRFKKREIALFDISRILLTKWNTIKNTSNNRSHKSKANLITNILNDIDSILAFENKEQELKAFFIKIIEILNTYFSLKNIIWLSFHFFNFSFKKSVELII